MTPEESKVLKDHLKAAAAILLNNTPKEELKSFNGIEPAILIITFGLSKLLNFERGHRLFNQHY